MKRTIIFLCLILISFKVFSDDPIDSLQFALEKAKGTKKIDILNELAYRLRNSGDDKSLLYAEEARKLSEEGKYEKGIAKSNYRLGYYFFMRKNYDTALDHFLVSNQFYTKLAQAKGMGLTYEFAGNVYLMKGKYNLYLEYMDNAIISYKKIDAQNKIARIYTNSSYALTRLGRYEQALEYLYFALGIREDNLEKDPEITELDIARTYKNIGATLLKTKDFQLALDYFFKTLVIYKKFEHTDGNLFNNIGIAYQQMENYEKSTEYHLQALEVFKEENDIEQIASVMNNIGYVYDMQKDWATALQYYLESLQLKKKTKDNFGIANSAKNVGSIYLEINELEKAQKYVDESMLLAEKENFVEIIKDNNYLYSRLFEKYDNYKSALYFERLYTAAKDSIYTKSMREKIAELETSCNINAQRKENEILQRDKEILMLQAEKSKWATMRSYFIVSILLLIVVLISVFYLKKVAQEKLLSAAQAELKKKVLERTQELERINVSLRQEVDARKKTEKLVKDSLQEKEVMLREIHHRVKNNLQIISSIISLQIAEDNLDDKVLNLLLNVQNRIYSMSLIHEKLYLEENLAKIDFESYTKGLIEYILSNYQEKSVNIISNVEIENIRLNVTTGIPLGLLINEIVTNSIKYAFPEQQKGQIFIKMEQDDKGKINLIIGNNGIPFDFTQMKSEHTIGLRLIELLARQMHAELKVENTKGVQYILQFEELK